MTKIRRQLQFDKNPIEAIRDSGSSFAHASQDVLSQELSKDVTTAWKQLLGAKEEAQKPQKNNQEEVIFEKKKKEHTSTHIENYFQELLGSEKRISNESHRELASKIEQLRNEIAKLARGSKQLEAMVKDVTNQNVSSNPGKYHLNFFEWVLATIQQARVRVEESANWLSQVSTKSQKKGFWGNVKKHGTSFLLSGERTPAQSTG